MTWLSISQLDGIPGLSPSRTRRREMLDRLGAAKRERESRGGGFEYLASSLPVEVQQAIAARAVGASAVKPVADAIRAGQDAKRAAQVQANAMSMARYGLTLEAQGGFDPSRNPRLDLFQRFECYHRTRGGAVWPAITEFCELWAVGQIDALPSTLSAYPRLPAKTLDKWYRAWRVSGVEALLDRKPRKDKGQSKLGQDDELYQVFISALAEMHDPTALQVRRVIAHQLGSDRVPARRTLERWICEFKATNSVALLKFKNPDGWRNKFMPAMGSRSEHITRPNEEWQLDSTIADAQQRSEIAFNLVDGVTGEIRRHALIACIDVFTRRASVLVSRTSSANAVKAVTRVAMLAYGMPERVKTDNGKDYTAQDYNFALDALNIEHLLCTPFSPDQKPFIERFLGTLLHDLFPMIHGFVGHDVTTRKAIESAKSFAQRFGDKGLDLHMSPEQLQGTINGWLDEYHNRVHSELGCSPNAMADRHTTHIVRVDERALDIFMMPVAGKGLRTVSKRGISMPPSAWYAAPELAAVMGQQVYCRQVDSDMGALYVHGLGGEFICRAVDHALLGINRSELAAKSRAIHAQTIKPMVDRFRKAKTQGLVRDAVKAIYTEREAAAVQASDNVTRLQPRVVMETTPAIESLVAARSTSVQDGARASARATLDAQDAAPVAAVLPLASPNARYSAWVRLQARMERGEAISDRDQAWGTSYQASSEFEAWHCLHEGSDPLADAGG